MEKGEATIKHFNKPLACGNRTRGHVKSNQGFSLIELMVVIALIGILTQIAVPSYNGFLTKQRRTDGQALLLENQSLMEECLAISGTPYDQCALRLTSAEGYYNLLAHPTPTTYTLAAVPTGKNNQDNDTECMSLTITHDRRYSATGTAPESCW